MYFNAFQSFFCFLSASALLGQRTDEHIHEGQTVSSLHQWHRYRNLHEFCSCEERWAKIVQLNATRIEFLTIADERRDRNGRMEGQTIHNKNSGKSLLTSITWEVFDGLPSWLPRLALHIAPHLPYWTLCSDTVSAGYNREFATTIKFYETIMTSGKKPRILLYNGDIDMACNFLGDEWFVDSLGKNLLVERRPWLVKVRGVFNYS